MKIALCILGLYRKNVSPPPPKLIKGLRGRFPTADVYYHTWSEKFKDVPIEYQGGLETCPQPKMDYHPVLDTGEECQHKKFSAYKQKRLMIGKQKFASLQILAYADLYSKIPQQYDLYIRARWDTKVSGKINFNDQMQEALKGPVGFMYRRNRNQIFDKLVPVNREDKADDWYGYLCDSMIIHTPQHFDPNLVRQLHRDKKLWPAEWGWYQVMSKPYGDIHQCYHGGADLAR